MKYTAHVPTEQFGFISIELEGTAEEAVQAYKELAQTYKGGAGISSKEFNDFLDVYVSTGHPPEGGLQVWEQMDEKQKHVVNELKKLFKRLTK